MAAKDAGISAGENLAGKRFLISNMALPLPKNGMRKGFLFLFLSLLLVAFIVPASPSAKIWILFKDRPYLHGRSLRPQTLTSFTPASVRRREIRGIVPWDESDFPVDPSYVSSLQKLGAKVLVKSRWLNGVSAICDGSCRQALSSLNFVAEIRPVIRYHRRVEEKITPESATSPEFPLDNTSLAYGNSLQQLKQLSVPFAHQKGFAGQGEIIAIFDAGFRKDHIAFKSAPIVAEHDYVFNRDFVSDVDGHGTSTWSCVGGAAPGKLFGPAYKASFILAITEDVRSETQVEEDNWVAAFEWADRLGATVVSSSLGYSDWYTPADFDGETAITSKVASTATKKGIVVANSAGNEGPGSSTLSAPADAKNILTVGAVDGGGNIAFFSSRGPTADGRLKPEVVARGVLTWVAADFSPTSFGRGNGTSFSCPLVAGSAAVLLSAHPEWNPLQIREAFINTSSRASAPDNTYGYGIPNLQKALDYLPVNAVAIDHIPLKNTSNTSQPYEVRARIRAARGLNTNELFINWKRAGTATFQKVKMTAVSGLSDQFQGAIPAQSRGTTVLYYLTVKDSTGKVFKDPFYAPKESFQFSIQ